MQNDLINDLTMSHQKRPFWKGPHALLGIWLGLYLSVFAFEAFSHSDLRHSSSLFFIILIFSGSALSWWMFAKNLNSERSNLGTWLGLIVLIIGVAFAYDSSLGMIGQVRSMSLSDGDLRCFGHIVLSTLIPIALYPFFIKHFFVSKIYWAIAFLAAHISLMGIAVLEFKCHDRELWHLILGHQSAALAVFGIMSGIFFIRKKLFV